LHSHVKVISLFAIPVRFVSFKSISLLVFTLIIDSF
jgi:hypothetical protein